MARALAAEPKLLLMDEPFGALDPIIRTKAQEDLISVRRSLGTTVVMVTHDMSEALRLADHLVVMGGGRILQQGSPASILARPATRFVEAMVGSDERSFRFLSLRRVGDLVEGGTAEGEPIDADLDARAALGALLWSGRSAAPVSLRGSRIGVVGLERLLRLARDPLA